MMVECGKNLWILMESHFYVGTIISVFRSMWIGINHIQGLIGFCGIITISVGQKWKYCSFLSSCNAKCHALILCQYAQFCNYTCNVLRLSICTCSTA